MIGRRFSRRGVWSSSMGKGEVEQGVSSSRLAPRGELINVPEFEDMAKLELPSSAYSIISGGDRRAFDRMTFRTRRMVNSLKLDLTTELFGEPMFAPLLVAPIAQQTEFHPRGELATVEGAAAAKTIVVINSRSSYSIEQIAAQAETTLWYQVDLEADANSVSVDTRRAVKAGCKALCITVATPSHPRTNDKAELDWRTIDLIRRGIKVPVLLKGISTREDAEAAVNRGIQGIVVSDYGGVLATKAGSPIEILPSISRAVRQRIPILIDGSFRRGSDVLKALALGAQAVLLGRPPMWGLSSYGSRGVQTVLELLQTELGRSMAGLGRPNIKSIDSSLVRVHKR